MDPKDILQQLHRFNDARVQGQFGAREAMLDLAHALVSSLETPSEFVSRIGWMEPARSALLRSAMDLNLLESVSEQSRSGKGVSIEQLAQSTGAERALLGEQSRSMKHLSATNIVEETSEDEYRSTNLSKALTEPKYRNGVIYCYDVAGPSFRQLPDFFSKTKYANPLDPVDGPFQFTHKTDLHFFPWLGQNPKYFAAFASYMSGYRASKIPWHDENFYPVQQKLFNIQESEPLLVDVGGGMGHDIADFRAKFPELPGRLILQDKPEVIEQAKQQAIKEQDIELQPHDFFTEQPVKGARVYYLHSVLHDWDDESCVKILKNLIPALGPDSKILINEYIVPDQAAGWGVTSMDMLMMALGSVQERKDADFRRVIASAGLSVKKIWSVGQGTESLIEVGL